MKRFFVTGTDTGVGKTVVSAVITKALEGCYWKPIQSGLADEAADRVTVQSLTNLPDHHFFDSAYELQAPLSPHHAAERENVEINIQRCQVPTSDRTLIAEGAGGVFVPVNQRDSMLDLMAHLNFPVIVVARGTLGTINHTLLTLAALRQCKITICGVVFNGELNPDNQKTIEQWGNVRTLFHVPRFDAMENSQLQVWMNQQKENILNSFSAACREHKELGVYQGGEWLSPLIEHGDSLPVRSQNN